MGSPSVLWPCNWVGWYHGLCFGWKWEYLYDSWFI